MKLIRDPVHGYIEVPDRLLPIVSNPLFQRLRYVKQTALAYMVYPGMNHTRFEHSLGVMHLSLEFLKYIRENSSLELDQEVMELIAVTAMLHDVGHLPFSHTFENALQVARQVYGVDVFEKDKKTHVILGTQLIEKGLASDLEKNFKTFEDPVKFVTRVLMETPRNREEKLAHLIISNFIDADRSDYLLRDSYYAGVEYGQFDIERMKRFLYFENDMLVVLGKVLPIVEQFLLARMYMFQNVYFHSVVGMYNAILSQAIAQLLRDGIIEMPVEVEDFLVFDDNFVISKLQHVRRELRDAIMYRQGFRRIKIEPSPNCIEKLESIKQEIREDMRSSGGLLIYHEFNDVPYREEKDEAVYILTPHGVERLKRVSPLIGSLSEIRKVVVGYHVSRDDLGRKYEKILSECKD
ncbi:MULTISPECIES: HD domain-containing protein [Metallosphaera]|uniref:Metal dependent phosphohydrolase n=3 Tax=Metallosphaera TaxID=41980 RepID=A4YH30_METS5|nr:MULTISPECIES: HD domain-containing protein [Metallosphaera]ABP95732.1 metal dependent phosphohydrolase [Metallosphaera sedula DSM 5348]AIM27716.1 metal dependent phosphohydrolase [Metallosphaera sedula]AKV74572.1 phosphohydrolase [Metallosphaera sedula]AKV76811.1 phosphohydrolase [Metallosphaera sedula]AKV79062.1 phosphohydrolase [Metallosphaera sedula]